MFGSQVFYNGLPVTLHEDGSVTRQTEYGPITTPKDGDFVAQLDAAARDWAREALVTKAAHDPVNHPSHYTSHPAKCSCGAQIECIQITEHMGFNLGNAVKYLWRADLKGAAIQDLSKAVWYIEREIAKRKAESA